MARLQSPPNPPPWPSFFRDWVEKELLPWLERSQLVESETVRIHETETGRQPLPIFPGVKASKGGAATHPWQPRSSPWLGGGITPENQGLKILIRHGTCDNKSPSNMTEEFLLPASTTTVFWLDLQINEGGGVTELTIDSGSDYPDMPDPADPDINGGYPTEMFVPIFEIVTGEDKPVFIEQLESSSMSLIRSISSWDGEKYSRSVAINRPAQYGYTF